MSPPLPDGLRAWVALRGPSAVVAAVRERAARGHSTETGRLNVTLDEAARREVGRLLGTQWVLAGAGARAGSGAGSKSGPGTAPVTLERLTVALVPYELTVRELAEAVGGPIPDRRRQRFDALTAAEVERRCAVGLLVDAGVAAEVVERWVADPALPRPGGNAGSQELAELAALCAEVWRKLPGPAGMPVRLAALAAEQAGDAHALDADRLLGRAVARLAATAGGLERPMRGGRAWREAWASVGVLCDAVSSRVLVLNLPLVGEAAAVRMCAVAAKLGEPVWLTLRSLAGSWAAPGGTVVHVCENPTVVEAAADRLGAACPPLVCTDGMPTTTAVDLVRGLAAAGCELRLRADVDGTGIAIVRMLLAAVAGAGGHATLWRYDEANYTGRRGGGSAVVRPPGGGVADGQALDDLAAAFSASGRPLHEEHLLDDLLADLSVVGEADGGTPSVLARHAGRP